MESADLHELRGRVRTIGKDVLDAKVTRDSFVRSWPDEADKIPFFKEIYDDLADAVEHTPGFWFRPGVDVESWRESDFFYNVYLDYVLLGYRNCLDELMRCRQTFQNRADISADMIENEARKYFSL